MTTDSGFDMDKHRQWLAGLGTPELQQHTARLDPARQPEAWRAAVEELSRRGIVYSRQPPQPNYYQPAYYQQPAHPPQPQPYAYQHPPPGPKKSSIPLGVRMGCMGCVGMFIFICLIFTAGINIISDMFPEMIVKDFSTVDGNGWIGVVYESQGSFLSMIRNGPNREKSARFRIFENGEWRNAPAPAQAGPMATRENNILLLGENGEYSLPLDSSGRPAGAWSKPRPIEGTPLRCPIIFSHGGSLFYLFEVKGAQANESTAYYEHGEVVLYNRSASRIEKEGPIIGWLADHDTSLCRINVIEHEGKLLLFESVKDSRSSNMTFDVHTYNNGTWERRRFPDTFMSGSAFEAAILNGSPVVYYMTADLENMTPGKIFRNRGSGFQKLDVRRLRGDSWEKLPNVPIQQEPPQFFNPASDGKTDFLITRRMMARDFDVVQFKSNAWERVHTAQMGFSPMSFIKNKTMFFAIPISVCLLLLIVFLSSMMIAKERGCELLLPGRTVAMPTLWRRFAAFAIDWGLFHLPFMICGLLMTDTIFKQPALDLSNPKYILGSMMNWIGLLSLFSYMTLTEGLFGRTLGKKIMGLRVVREDLSRCNIGWAALRNVVRILDGMLYYAIGGIVFAHTDKFQRVGDLAAKTVVVMDAPGLPLPPGSVPPAPPPTFNAPPPQTPYNPADFAPPPSQYPPPQ